MRKLIWIVILLIGCRKDFLQPKMNKSSDNLPLTLVMTEGMKANIYYDYYEVQLDSAHKTLFQGWVKHFLDGHEERIVDTTSVDAKFYMQLK